jgi:hypothetical protein
MDSRDGSPEITVAAVILRRPASALRRHDGACVLKSNAPVPACGSMSQGAYWSLTTLIAIAPPRRALAGSAAWIGCWTILNSCGRLPLRCSCWASR